MTSLTEYRKKTRIEYLNRLITMGDQEPGTSVTFDLITLNEIDHGKKRVEHPRLNWHQVTLQDLWSEAKKDHSDGSVRFAAKLDLKKETHVNAIKTYAKTQHEKNIKTK